MTCTGTSCNQGRAECRDGCTKLIQTNSDGSDPHAEARDLIEVAFDAVLGLLMLGGLVFFIFAALGFWSAT